MTSNLPEIDPNEELVSSRVPEAQILIAGIGNAFLADDGFGPEVARRIEAGELPPGVSVHDFGTGGLDLAYEVMRGYHALVIVDAGKQGEPPGTLFVMEPDEEEFAGPIEDGELLDPHDMNPRTVLRFIKAVNGWPGKVVVVSCEPAQIDEMGFGLSDEVAAAIDDAVALVMKTVEELRCTSSP